MVLRVHHLSYPDVVDPQKSSTTPEIDILQLAYEGLTRLDTNQNTVPGAAESWAGNSILQARLVAAVDQAREPIFFLQAMNDYNIAPSLVLSGEMCQRDRFMVRYPANADSIDLDRIKARFFGGDDASDDLIKAVAASQLAKAHGVQRIKTHVDPAQA